MGLKLLVELDKGQAEFLIKVLETSSGIFDSSYNLNMESQEYKLVQHLKQALEWNKPFENFQDYRIKDYPEPFSGSGMFLTPATGRITATSNGSHILGVADAGRIAYDTEKNQLKKFNGISWELAE
jgi:hypothetical protein